MNSAFVNSSVRLLLQVAISFAVMSAMVFLILRTNARAHGDDLVQDYISARAMLDGESPYQTLNELRARLGFPPTAADVKVRWNPHPPGAVLLTVPFAFFDFGDALFWLQAVQLLAVAITWAIAYRLFDPPMQWWLWALLGGLFGLWTPLWQGLDWGQPVGMLALAVVGVWALARADRPALFGLVLGFACTIRPFVAILVVLTAGWSVQRRIIAVAAALLGGLLPFLVTGIEPWEWFQRASDARGYVDECGTLAGLLGIGTRGGEVLFALAACVLAYLRYRGLSADSTAALAAVAAMLTYPLAWFQYDVSLIAVVAWVAAQVGKSGNRFAMFGLVLFLLMRTIPDIIPDPQGTGITDVLGRNKAWVQVTARAILLLTVAAAARRFTPQPTAPVSVYAPS